MQGSPPLAAPVRALAGALLIGLSAAAPLRGQNAPGVLTVVVRAAADGAPLAGAQVLVQGVGMAAVTNEQGVARVAGLLAGARRVEVQYLGYAPAAALVVVSAISPMRVSFDLRASPIELAPLEVRAMPRSHLDWTGFTDRRARGFGDFFDYRDIERIRPHNLSDLLRRLPGVNLSPLPGSRAHASFRGPALQGCPIQYFVDNVPIGPFFEVDDVIPIDVAGIEIYRGPATVPPQFRWGSAGCGVIVIWTKTAEEDGVGQ